MTGDLYPDGDDDTGNLPEHANQTNEAVLSKVQTWLDVTAQLHRINPALACLFEQYFGISTITTRQQAPDVCQALQAGGCIFSIAYSNF